MVPESDHLTLLHIFQRYRSSGCRAAWCNKHFLNSKGMRKAAEVRSQLVDLMKEQGMEVSIGYIVLLLVHLICWIVG